MAGEHSLVELGVLAGCLVDLRQRLVVEAVVSKSAQFNVAHEAALLRDPVREFWGRFLHLSVGLGCWLFISELVLLLVEKVLKLACFEVVVYIHR